MSDAGTESPSSHPGARSSSVAYMRNRSPSRITTRMRSNASTAWAASATRANTWRSSIASPIVRATAARASRRLARERPGGDSDIRRGASGDSHTRTPIARPPAADSGTLRSPPVAVVLSIDLLQPRMHPGREGPQEHRRHLQRGFGLARIEFEAGLAERPQRRRGITQEARPQRLIGGEPTDHDLDALLAHAAVERK